MCLLRWRTEEPSFHTQYRVMPCTAFVLHTNVVSFAPVLVLKETPVGQLIVNAFVPHVEYKLPSTISSPFLVLAREGKFIVIAPPPVQMPYLLLETRAVPLVSLRYAPLETPPRAWGRLVKCKSNNPYLRNTPTGVGKT